MKRIAITGATGFLGRRCVEYFTSKNYEVVALGRNIEIGKQLEILNAKFINCDLQDFETLKKAFANCEFVVHSAALSTIWGEYEDFYNTNVIGTKNVVEACIANNVQRLIHISTPSIYIENRDKLNIHETDKLPNKFANHYANSKRQAEILLEGYFSKIEIIGLRPQGIFGPYDNAILPRILKIADRGFIPKINSGHSQIDLTYVDNVVLAIEKAILADKTAVNRFYNITNGEPVNQLKIIIKLLNELGYEVKVKSLPYKLLRILAQISEFMSRYFKDNKEPTLTVYSINTLAFSRTLNIESAKKLLNYSPQYSMEEGIQKTVKWWRENHVQH